MILAFDTYYIEDKAKTVCLAFESWEEEHLTDTHIEFTECLEEYKPGEFYKRELPGILNILKKIDLNDIDVIIVDGYVVLDDSGKLGLGGHLYESLYQKIAVVGVAKSNFFTLNTGKHEVLRGESTRPLYITALGIDSSFAAQRIKQMKGEFRMPDLLKELDRLTKENT